MVPPTTVDSGCGAASFPLSPMQQGMLFHRVEGGPRGVDIEQVVCELHHPVGGAEFEQACLLMAQRHDSLRTRFLWQDGAEPQQMVLPPEQAELPVRVLDFGDPAGVEAVVEQYLAADRRTGFASLNGPLARAALFCAGRRAWFVFTYHHLVLDARGMHTLFKELLDTCDALTRGQPPALPPVRPYRDYIAWLQTLDLHRAEAFWREQLRGLEAPTVLPLPHPAEPEGDFDLPGELSFRLGEAATARLREAAKRHEVTLNTLLQGAWAVVLSRYTGENDVVFGAVRACRHVPVEGAQAMIGMLINTVPLRVQLASAASVSHWLKALREQWIALRDFEHTPLARAQQWSGAAAGRPLFDTLFNFQEPSWMGALRKLGGVWEKRRFDIRSQPNYPLSLDIYGDDALLVRAFYDRSRFTGDAVGRLLRHFRAAILSLADPHTDTLGDAAILDEQERELVLNGFNATAADYPRDVCAHTLFEQHAAAAPERLAVADPASSLTYGELNRWANQLAHRLKGLGVGPDVRVAVCMPRSIEMIVAWLAALKAGGAFVPIDPEYPAERLSFQLRNCGAPVLLTHPRIAGALPELPSAVQVIEVKADQVADEPGENVPREAAARNLAYVIYTSGSTGQPKGVEIEHRALLNLISWHQRTYAVTPQDRATHLASPAFDASVWEIWPYLAAGASIHIPDDDVRLAPAALWPWMAERKITIAFMPTPLAEAALAEPWPASLALRALLTGGDALKRPAPADFPCPLINHYGPTESTVVATAAAVPQNFAGAPPIGRPIANTKAYVLDRSLKPVPVGVPGELYLGGESLARGYLLRPELTAEKFITSPFAERPARKPAAAANASDPSFNHQPSTLNSGAAATPPRLYRTGDLVRWRPDGQLDFLGRIDNQVKIRGCRIELGEIEAVLQRHPSVREAVVLARPDDLGQPQLAAYVVGHAGQLPSEPELTEFARAALPSYMVPAAIVILDAWPLTPNGKVDRRALPAPATRKGAPEFVLPRTAQQQTIARIWADVLGRGPIGLYDNFFELGGQSILAAQAITRLNAALGASISVRMIFDHPTVFELANELDRGSAAVPARPALRPKPRTSASDLELVQPL